MGVMLPLVALISLTQQDPLAQPLVFNQPAGLLRKVVAQLSAQTHVPMRVSDAVWDVGVYVESMNWTLKQVMDGLADVSFGIWEKQPDSSWLLRKSSVAESVARSAEVKRLTPIIQEWQEARQAHANKPEPTLADLTNLARFRKEPESMGNTPYPDVTWPSARLVSRLQALLPAAEIARMPIGKRIVYSTDPTAAQRPLDAQRVGQILRAYVTETEKWRRAGVAGDDGEFYGQLRDTLPARLQLSLKRPAMDGEIDLVVTAFSESGAEWARFPTSINLGQLGVHVALEKQEAAPPSKFSKETQQWINQLSLRGSKPPSKELLAKFLDFEKRDPIIYVPTDVCRGLAEKAGGNLVSAAPDALTIVAIMGGDAEVSSMGDIQVILNQVEIAELRPGVYRARLPELLQQHTHSRDLWAKLQALNGQRKLMAADLQEYEAAAFPGYFSDDFFGFDISDVGFLLIAMSNVDPGQKPFEQGSRALWWGGLTATQRAEVLSGRAVSLTQLNNRQRWLIATCLYDGDSLRMDGVEEGAGAALLEPTIAFPTAPTQGSIRAESKQRPTFLLVKRDGKSPLYGDDPQVIEDLAQQLLQAKAEKLEYLIQPYRTKSTSVRLDLGRGLYMTVESGKEEHVTIGKASALTALPADLQKRIADLMKAFEEPGPTPDLDDRGGEIKPPQR